GKRKELLNAGADIEGFNDLNIHMDNLFGLFLRGARFDDRGELIFTRDITKNPLTITVYGSGATGIAGNFVEDLTNSIYATLSNAVAAQQNGDPVTPDLLFPNAPSSSDAL